MVKSCGGCANRFVRGSSISFHRFPPEGTESRERWIAAIRRKDWRPDEFSYVCSSHFVSGKRSRDPKSPDYVPSIFFFLSSPDKRAKQSQLAYYSRHSMKHSTRVENEVYLKEKQARKAEEARKKREEKIDSAREAAVKAAEEASSAAHTLLQLGETVEAITPDCDTRACQTDIGGDDLLADAKECCQLQAQLHTMRESSISEFSEERLHGDDGRVKFYTGLPSFGHLQAVYRLVVGGVDAASSSVVPMFHQFVAVYASEISLRDLTLQKVFAFCTSRTIFQKQIPVLLRLISLRKPLANRRSFVC